MKKHIFIFSILLAAFLFLVGCGNESTSSDLVESPLPVSSPTPTPFLEPILDGGIAVTFDGTDLPSGSFVKDNTQYAKLSEISDAIGGTISHNDSEFTLSWKRGEMYFSVDEHHILCSNGDDLLVPVDSFCEDADINMLLDEEYHHLYCTSSAGDWEIPQGYTCPVFMYHSVTNKPIGLSNCTVKPEKMEEQLKYLVDNGYSPIWFEDLENIQDYEKPVILVFDDGWKDNYENLFPLLQKYNVKVTIALVPVFVDESKIHLTSDMIKEMNESGLVRFESHTYHHDYLDTLPVDQQYNELADSKLWVTRMTGIEPIVLVYPTGITTSYVQKLINEDHVYRFGVKMLGMRCYNTSDDPAVVWRYFPERQTTTEEYAMWLEAAFKDKS